MSGLVIDVTDVLEEAGSRTHLALDERVEGLESQLSRVDDTDPLHLDLLIESVEEGLLVRGRITGRFATTCRRCLADAREDFGIEVAEVFRPSGDVWEEGYVIRDRSIDLRPLVNDNVMLGMPLNPLCRSDCKGLCPRCGATLNAGPCSCPPEREDDRWAALRSLLEQ